MVQWAELEGNKHSGNSFSDSRASCRQGGISSKGVDADGKGTTEARAARTTATADEYSQERYPCVVEYASCGTKAKGGEEEDVSTRRIRCRRVLVTVGLGVLKVCRRERGPFRSLPSNSSCLGRSSDGFAASYS